ncbi:cupin domain-containing protein [Glaciecola sp. KUL10]|uniref:cupin domain-containing protein n=1 Tax=Glaciecola sp. (strain KUL10) TaxID=2161813 RepID=UPI000D781B6C|nr:cupin domain-containing protein [Glaciecola sp. KUL10]GBL05160.1 transcriptional regulator [Glaciecola sp. KUL10]
MKINSDFDKRVIVHSADLDWVSSPMQGVDRRPLDRVGDEVARATTIVRYAPGSTFSSHVHTGGEEFVVIEGVFQDEHGDFPTGSYIRNPPGSSHTPRSDNGCVILVKLWQFEPDDSTHVRLRTDRMFSVPLKDWLGVSITPLYKDAIEQVSMIDLEADAVLSMDVPNGAELYVMEGEIEESGDALRQSSWLRQPIDHRIEMKAGKNGARVWCKTGHIREVEAQIQRVKKHSFG